MLHRIQSVQTFIASIVRVVQIYEFTILYLSSGKYTALHILVAKGEKVEVMTIERKKLLILSRKIVSFVMRQQQQQQQQHLANHLHQEHAKGSNHGDED